MDTCARTAARSLTHGRLRDPFYYGALGPRLAAFVLLGMHLALFAQTPNTVAGGVDLPLATLGSAFALVGLAVWEHLWVVAGQEPPLS